MKKLTARHTSADEVCRHCAGRIFKRFGFWNLWQLRDCSHGDPEYCAVSNNHAHEP